MISIIESKYINLGISQLAGYLRHHGVNVDLLFFHDGESNDYIISQIGCNYTYYAFSISQTNVVRIQNIVKVIKRNDIDSKIIFGGSFASMYYEEIARDIPLVDYIVLGDGEVPMMHLISGKPLNDYPYIYTSKNLSSHYEMYQNNIIDWEIAEDYFVSNNKKRHIHSIISKNNICTGSCTFCCTYKSRHIEYKPIDTMVSEIIKFNDLYGVSHFYFIDNDLFDPGNQFAKERIFKFCEKVLELGKDLHFYCSAKATTFKDNESDNALLEIMYMAGFDSVFLGIEAANNDDLKLYNKKNRVDDNINSLDLLRKHKIHPDIGFICFNPYSSLSTLKDNFQFLIDSKIENITHYTQSFLEIYKDSPLYNLAKKQNLLGEKYDYMHLDQYKYISHDADKIISIVSFLKEQFKDSQEFAIEDSWSRFAVFYNGLLRYNKSLEVFNEEYNLLKQQYFDSLHWYFSKLYIDNDIEFCRTNFDRFLLEYQNNKKELYKLRARIIMKDIRSHKDEVHTDTSPIELK